MVRWIIVNVFEEFESIPVVIGKSENTRCFKGVKKTDLPVHYFHQKKVWMTAEILDKILSKIDRNYSASSLARPLFYCKS